MAQTQSYPPLPPPLSEPLPPPSFSPANLNAIFKSQKKALLDDIERSISSYILNTGAQCVAVVQKIPRDTSTPDDPQYFLRKHEMHMDSNMFEFARVLIKFMLNQRHDGFELDSALTEPILGIINDRYIELYKAHDQEISSVLLGRLKNDAVLLNSFVGRLTSVLAEDVSEAGQEQITRLIVHQIHDAASNETSHAIGQQVSLLATSAVGTHVAHVAAHAVMKTISVHVGRIVAKFLASEAFKKLMMAMIHQVVMRVVTAAVLQVLTVTFGGAIGAGAIMWIIIPIVVGLLAKQIMDFPKKLGKAVSERVKAHLDAKYGVINKTILGETFQKIFNGPGLLKAVVEDEEIRVMFKTLGEKISGEH